MKHESELALEKHARESGGLLERLEESRRRIGKMCSERRGPRMTIPVNWADDDFFICLAIEDAIEARKQPALETSVPRFTGPYGGDCTLCGHTYDSHGDHRLECPTANR